MPLISVWGECVGEGGPSRAAGVLMPRPSPPCCSHPHLTGTSAIRILGSSFICPWYRQMDWMGLAADLWEPISLRTYLGIYVPLCFLISLPFCNQSAQKHHSSALRHSAPCAGRVMVWARGGESLQLWCILLSASPPVVEGSGGESCLGLKRNERWAGKLLASSLHPLLSLSPFLSF